MAAAAGIRADGDAVQSQDGHLRRLRDDSGAGQRVADARTRHRRTAVRGTRCRVPPYRLRRIVSARLWGAGPRRGSLH